jgi:hypothetical protein
MLRSKVHNIMLLMISNINTSWKTPFRYCEGLLVLFLLIKEILNSFLAVVNISFRAEAEEMLPHHKPIWLTTFTGRKADLFDSQYRGFRDNLFSLSAFAIIQTLMMKMIIKYQPSLLIMMNMIIGM